MVIELVILGHCRAIKSESPPINHHRMQSDIRHSIRPPESNVPWDDEVSHSLLSDYTREALETLALPPHQNEFYPNADMFIYFFSLFDSPIK